MPVAPCGRGKVIAVHLELVLLGLTAEDRMLVEHQHRAVRAPLAKVQHADSPAIPQPTMTRSDARRYRWPPARACRTPGCESRRALRSPPRACCRSIWRSRRCLRARSSRVRGRSRAQEWSAPGLAKCCRRSHAQQSDAGAEQRSAYEIAAGNRGVHRGGVRSSAYRFVGLFQATPSRLTFDHQSLDLAEYRRVPDTRQEPAHLDYIVWQLPNRTSP